MDQISCWKDRMDQHPKDEDVEDILVGKWVGKVLNQE
jgi:hypothetical protein